MFWRKVGRDQSPGARGRGKQRATKGHLSDSVGRWLLINRTPRAAGDRAGGALNSATLGAARGARMGLPRHPRLLPDRGPFVLATELPAHGQQPWDWGALPGDEGTPALTSPGFSRRTIFPGSVCGAGKRVSKAALLFKALIVHVLDTGSYILLSFDASASWPGQPEEGS